MRATIGIRELRENLTATIRRVRRGETIAVTHDGEPVALLTPFPRDRLARLLAGGDVSRPRLPFAVPERQFAVTGVMTASEALADDRGD